MNRRNQSHEEILSAKRRLQVSEALRGLGVILNTAAIYHPEHPVFQRAVDDRFPAFKEALATGLPLTVFFDKDAVMVANTAIEPGNDIFRKIARVFSGKGISGLTFHPKLAADELISLVMIVRDEMGRTGEPLSKLLQKKGIKHIKEERVSKGGGDASGKGLASGSEADGTGQAGSAGKQAKTSAGGKGSGGVFELDLDDMEDMGFDDGPLKPDYDDTVATDVGSSQVKTFVLTELRDLQSGRKNAQSVAENIASDFEQRLNERIEEVRRETHQRIQRLESIKDLVLQELEVRGLAAVIVNAQLQVIALNNGGRTLLGNIEWLEPESELAEFAHSNDEKRSISVRGKQCRADMIISDHPDDEGGAVLICLEPEK